MFLEYIVSKNYNIHSPAKSFHKFSKFLLNGCGMYSTGKSNFVAHHATLLVDPPATILKTIGNHNKYWEKGNLKYSISIRTEIWHKLHVSLANNVSPFPEHSSHIQVQSNYRSKERRFLPILTRVISTITNISCPVSLGPNWKYTTLWVIDYLCI